MIYLDNCATTKTDKSIADIMYYYNTENFFNPSALYSASEKVKLDILNARKNIAKILNVDATEIIFTSSGTESNNTVLNSNFLKQGDNLIISAGEHPSIYNTATNLAQKNIEIRICPLKKDATLDVEKLLNLIDNKTKLISIIHVSNEFGTINDIKKIADLTKTKNKNVLIHSDGVQALGKIPINLKNLGVDYYSASSHKIYSPKGCGLLYKKKTAPLTPFILGGGQENGLRSGTENVGAIIAFSEALKNAVNNFMPQYFKSLREAFLENLNIDNYIINGSSAENLLDNILSISISGIKSEVIVHMLENKNIYIGTGSACSASKKNYRLTDAIGLNHLYADGTLRISFSKNTKIEDAKIAAKELTFCVNKFLKRETIEQ